MARRYGYNPGREQGKFRPGVRVRFIDNGYRSGECGTIVERRTREEAVVVGNNSDERDYWLVAWDGLSQLIYPQYLLEVIDA